MQLSIFEIAHIQEDISQYLSLQELVKCIQVSREWSLIFTRTLWQRFYLQPHHTIEFAKWDSPLSVLLRHHEDISKLNDKMFQKILDNYPAHPWSLPKLRSLSFLLPDDETQKSTITTGVSTATMPGTEAVKALRFLSTLSTIEDLSILGINGDNQQIQDELIHALSPSCLPRLRHVSLLGSKYSAESVLRIIIACRRCEFLDIRTTKFYNVYLNSKLDGRDFRYQDSQKFNEVELTELVKRAFDEGMPLEPTSAHNSTTNLRRLHYDMVSPGSSIILKHLLERSPQLKDLRLIGMMPPEPLQSVIGALNASKRTTTMMGTTYPLRLRSLIMNTLKHDETETKRLLAELIRSTGYFVQPESSHGDGHTDEAGHVGKGIGINGLGLESLSLMYQTPFGQRCGMALVQYHSKTLTKLTIKRLIKNIVFITLMSGLRELRSIEVKVQLDESEEDEISNSNDEEGGERSLILCSWTCQQLKELSLKMNVARYQVHNHRYRMQRTVSAQGFLGYIFKQISRLEALRELELSLKDRISVDVLTLSKGCLSCLGTLKQLRGLKYRKNDFIGYELGEEEAAWIIEHCPRLSEVALISPLPASFKEKLIALRPWILVTTVR
ncbi:hypothetical protein BX616_011290 [Lobosporangium transversale]|uniref:F-box domain-containing protein n=1 Tax=Lobosporangium transversale TaxID=64571 RepID=A0A1Y2H0P4_9FUNG|nr:hypothetical protein BCR41DRAFT_344691 [Lobosporangium transversale]KAF9909098.1 hypothetical protein BX616_011290 [Lobosporangium transversale]ORZ28130.1 hypothetical protein BCR41DRAFT_344691 [Lobosporangium transversale]|eukprot:XP_021885815.1 hypothetical protein BCR41DRAFT_344691 [Lobosporangium transversale]